MRRNKKILISAALLFLSGVFALGFAGDFVNSNAEVKAEDSLPLNTFKSIADGWNPNSTDFDKGYCHYVFEFNNEWGSKSDKSDTNLVSTVGQHVYLNGEKLSSFSNTEVYVTYSHGGKYLAVKLATSKVVAGESVDYCRLYFEEGTPFFNYAIPELTFDIDVTNYVCSVVRDPVKTQFLEVNWRNTIWGSDSHANLLDPTYEPNPIYDDNKIYPANGYLALVKIDPKNEPAKFKDEDNFAYDEEHDFKTKMRVNGVQVKDIEGVKVNGILGYLYFYINEPNIPNKDLYEYPTVDFESGIRMGDLILPKMTLQYVGKLGKSGDWKVIKASNKGIIWNRENEDIELFGDKKGLLVGLDKIIYDGTSDNLLDTFGSLTKLNGVSFNNLTNAEIRIYDSNNLWFYADEMETSSEELNVIKFDGTEYGNQVVDGFSYYRQAGDNNYWSSRTSNTKKQLTFYYDSSKDYWGSKWPSGHVYEGEGQHQYCGGKYKSGTKEGYLLSFNESFSDASNEKGGQFKYINLRKENIGHHIYSRGIPLCDIEGSEIMYHSEGNLWIWEPEMAKPYDGKNYAEVTIDGGTLFFDSELPEIHIYHEDYMDFSTFSNGNGWRIKGTGGYTGPTSDRKENYLKLDEKTPDINTWLGPFTWNNHGGDGTVIFAYGHHPNDYDAEEEGITKPTYLKKSGVADGNNLAKKDFSIGWKLKLNGRPIWEIDGAIISYQNAENFFSVVIPVKYTIAFNGYKVPTLTLEDGANFHDVSLEGFEVYFNSNEKWQKEKIDTVSDVELNTATQYTEVFDRTVLDSEVHEIEGINPNSMNNFAFEFSSSDANAAFGMNLFGKSNDHSLGIVVDLRSKTFILSDNSNGSKQLGEGAYSFRYDTGEWARFYISAQIYDGKMYIIVAIDDIVIAEIPDVTLGNKDNFGNVMHLYTNEKTIEFSDVRTDSSIKRPTIQYTGKDLYRFYEGEQMPDLLPLFSANDMLTDITSSIKLNYEEGMVNEDGSLNKGDYTVSAVATSQIGVTATKEVRFVITSPDEVVVTFNGSNPTIYQIGDYIVKPEDPKKESESGHDYKFSYWEYNNEEWDFEHYYVTQDTNLTAKFVEVYKEYTVEFAVEGLDSNYTLSFKFILGANISFDFLEKDGYTFEVYDGTEKISYYKVTGDHKLTVKYTKIKPTPDPEPDPPTPKKGCGGSIVGASIIASTLALGAVSLLLLKKKEEK